MHSIKRDKVNWESLWSVLMQHGVSQHLVSILLFIYYSQSGKVVRLVGMDWSHP